MPNNVTAMANRDVARNETEIVAPGTRKRKTHSVPIITPMGAVTRTKMELSRNTILTS